MAFKEAFGEWESRLPPSHSKARPSLSCCLFVSIFFPASCCILMRNATSSEFDSTPPLPNPLVCPLIDETRQTLRGYGLYKVDLNAVGC